MVVNNSHSRTKPAIAQTMILGSAEGIAGREPRGPPPEPPKRSRFLRRKSSSELTVDGPVDGGRAPRLGGSPHGPLGGTGGSSPPPLPPLPLPPDPVPEPQGPLMSANKARRRAPKPSNMLMHS